MKYYKAFNEDMTCRGFQYEVSGIYELPKDEKLELCEKGFHFCDILNYCFNFYDENSCVICEVEPLGNIVRDKHTNKLATDKIRIVRKLSKKEIEKERYIIQDGVRTIGNCVFRGCNSLTNITIPNSVTTIGEWAFANCKSLIDITISDSVTHIGCSAFYNTPFIEGFTDDFIILGNCLYKYQGEGTNIDIPDSVTSIGDFAFYDCKSLKSITIPNSVTSIGRGAFNGCKSLKRV